MGWSGVQGEAPHKYTCGFCGNLVSSEKGWHSDFDTRMRICPHCQEPTYFSRKGQLPGVSPGAEVEHLPANVEALYREARNCISIGANTSSVLAARKLLMHVAVEQGAKAGESFQSYVDFLAKKGYVPPNGQGWVDLIRSKGNEANHEIKLMTTDDANELITFAEMLLKFIYEFPNRVPKKSP